MATANLVNPKTEVISGNDNVVIVDNFQSVRGGRTLDVTGYTPTVLHAGHVIIRETVDFPTFGAKKVKHFLH